MVLDKGFAWNGETYGSLSQIAKAMTGTNWNGHRFFGLRTAKSDRSSKAGRNGWVSAPPDVASIQSTQDGKVRRRDSSLTQPESRNRGDRSRSSCRTPEHRGGGLDVKSMSRKPVPSSSSPPGDETVIPPIPYT